MTSALSKSFLEMLMESELDAYLGYGRHERQGAETAPVGAEKASRSGVELASSLPLKKELKRPLRLGRRPENGTIGMDTTLARYTLNKEQSQYVTHVIAMESSTLISCPRGARTSADSRRKSCSSWLRAMICARQPG